jgi:arylsulfatase A-like enzyme
MRSASLAAAFLATAAAAAALPNIIWLQSDSFDGRLLDPTDATMYAKLQLEGFKDKWLSQAVVFSRHYTNSPQCVPSRTSMLTGRYIHQQHTTNNGQGLAFSTKTGALDENCVANWGRSWCTGAAEEQRRAGVNSTFLDLAAAQGYELALFGRFDVGAGILQDYAGTTGDGFHDGPTIDILARGAGLWGEVDPEPYNQTSDEDAHPYAADVLKQQLAIEYVQARSPAEKRPLLLWLGLLCPHPPYDSNSSWLAHVNASNVDVPTQVPRNATHYYDSYMSKSKGLWDEDYTDTQAKRMRSTYWGAAAEATLLLEGVLLAAKAKGLLENTLVILTSDHGEMSLEHRQDLKNSLREPSVRVPLLVLPFGVPGLSAGFTVRNLTSHVDIFPTLAELVGAPGAAAGLPGRSLLPFLRPGAPPPPRPDAVAVQYHSNFAPCGSYGLLQGGYKLIQYGHAFPWSNATALPPQLFHTAADPLELTDLAPAQPARVAAMTAALEAALGVPLAAIEAQETSRNLADYLVYWQQRCTADSLVARLQATFKNGMDRQQIIERVAAWAGVSPLSANGTAAC